MIKNNEPYLVEFNVRMGDPECQTILPLLENDLTELIFNCCLGKLKNEKVNLVKKKVFALYYVLKVILKITKKILL